MSGDLLWKIQSTLRGNKWALPGFLLLASSLVVVYQHMSPDDFYPMRIWLTLILATMLPLFYLDVKISMCGDPLGMFWKFGPKVMFMHLSFLVLRLRLLLHSDVSGAFFLNFTNLAGLSVVSFGLLVVFRVLRDVAEHVDTLYYLAFSLVTSAATVVISSMFNTTLEVDNLRSHLLPRFLEELIMTAANYTEILAFVPAVWLLYRAEKKDEAPMTIDPWEVQKRALVFCFFLCGFYLLEDVVTAFMLIRELPLRALAHLLHFLLLVDFSVFLLACAYNPDKGRATLLQRLSDACAV